MRTRTAILAGLLGAISLPPLGSLGRSSAAEVVPAAEAAQTIVVRDLKAGDDSVSGTIVNKSTATVRGVELLLHQVWHWNDELHPGTDSPGRTLPLTVAGDVAPNGTAPFTFSIPRLPARTDGYFATTMDVVRFNEVRP